MLSIHRFNKVRVIKLDISNRGQLTILKNRLFINFLRFLSLINHRRHEHLSHFAFEHWLESDLNLIALEHFILLNNAFIVCCYGFRPAIRVSTNLREGSFWTRLTWHFSWRNEHTHVDNVKWLSRGIKIYVFSFYALLGTLLVRSTI